MMVMGAAAAWAVSIVFVRAHRFSASALRHLTFAARPILVATRRGSAKPETHRAARIRRQPALGIRPEHGLQPLANSGPRQYLESHPLIERRVPGNRAKRGESDRSKALPARRLDSRGA